YLAHAMPHKPLAASEKFYRQSESGLYGQVMRELDAGIGRVLAKLEDLKLAANTLVIFTSDNGAWFGGRCRGMRGMKGSSYEGCYRLPSIARWPGKIPAGHTSAEPAVMMDLYATSLAAANVPPPNGRVIDGRNLLPIMTSDAKSPHEAILGAQG